MDKHEFYIDFPDEATIQQQIDGIIEKGVKPKKTFYSFLKNMYKQIGIRYLFHDLVEIAFVVLIVIVSLIFIIINSQIQMSIDDGSIYTFIFIVSPILYMAVSLIAFVNTRLNNTYEIEMTCKYNLYQLAAFRMFVFSIISIIINSISLGLVTVYHKEINFLQALMLSITSLFLFSTIFLYLIFKIRSSLAKYIMVFVWIFENYEASIYSSEFYNMFLNKIPIFVYLAVVIAFAYAYIGNLKRLITFKNSEGVM